ncbi:multiple epidermal growth factor-like domains protein 11 [Ruditapes philippinarum]|uniref:multiple epidermal growth factor-like domains protein 11 n=1 Tax=Ruditapes philippinarum TaxID=129788 RepID=UPI00295BD4BB|nr:multiple epidermal growth factor-like domains protein 11 [Ruditapes philippinarum]
MSDKRDMLICKCENADVATGKFFQSLTDADKGRFGRIHKPRRKLYSILRKPENRWWPSPYLRPGGMGEQARINGMIHMGDNEPVPKKANYDIFENIFCNVNKHNSLYLIGCSIGKFGAECLKNCPSNCKNKYCNHVNGACIGGCKPGYQGYQCQERCSIGKFGAECLKNCPSNCKNIYCNHVNGACIGGCKPGYQGYQCQERCSVGKFGAECLNNCPSNCKSIYCNHVNGACTGGCKPGYQGYQCQESKYF